METHIRKLDIEYAKLSEIIPYSGNARKHSKRQVRKLADLISTHGWTYPILVDSAGTIIAGHGRMEAAKLLKLGKVPVLRITDLSEAQVKALRLADNCIAEDSTWDDALLRVELQDLIGLDADFEITATGFEMAEIDLVLGETETRDDADIADADLNGPPVARPGDLWQLGDSRLLCGNALDEASYEALLAGEVAEMVITDPPYNVPIAGHVSGLGKKKHGEFAMASGEMSQPEFTGFLRGVFSLLTQFSADGSIHVVFMDWRHQREMIEAADNIYSELKNVCVWAKGAGGMGSLYRSAHEFAYIFKAGKAPHINNVELGVHGRNRTNVWRYCGVSSFGKGRARALEMHPTVKPVAMIADAILDISKRKGLILDPFAGSGTILIAAQRTGRRARAMEIDPGYVDVALRRYWRVTGVEPRLAATGQTFSAVEAERLEAAPPRPIVETAVLEGEV